MSRPPIIVQLPAPVISITIGLPPKELSANSGKGRSRHWRPKAEAAKTYRELARYRWRERRIQAVRWRPLEVATTAAVFYWSDALRRDKDNAAATLKAAWDGAKDGKVITDDRGLIHLPPAFEIDRERPRVELHLFDVAVAFDWPAG